jgi:hypothetical protein
MASAIPTRRPSIHFTAARPPEGPYIASKLAPSNRQMFPEDSHSADSIDVCGQMQAAKRP